MGDLPDGVTYSQVSAEIYHSLLLRSDGRVVASGCNDSGQCTIPSLHTHRLSCKQAARRYIPDASLSRSGNNRVFQLSFSRSEHGISITCTSLAGEVLCKLMCHEDGLIVDVPARIAEEISVPQQDLRLVMPNGQLMSLMPYSTKVCS